MDTLKDWVDVVAREDSYVVSMSCAAIAISLKCVFRFLFSESNEQGRRKLELTDES